MALGLIPSLGAMPSKADAASRCVMTSALWRCLQAKYKALAYAFMPKQGGPPRPSTHRDYMLKEMAWMAEDVTQVSAWCAILSSVCAMHSMLCAAMRASMHTNVPQALVANYLVATELLLVEA